MLYTETSEGKNKVYVINPLISDYLEGYFELDFYGHKVVAPYFINTKRRKDLRALVGKGTPEEMVLETKVWAQVRGIDLHSAGPDRIRQLMQEVGIGIDCSGLVAHALNNYCRKERGFSITRKVNYRNHGPRAILARLFRPIENLGADDLTSELNCEVLKVNEVRPGDLIRGIGKQRNAFHVAIVTKVAADRIDYIHSHRLYGQENGVRKGSVQIVDPSKSFLEQNWLEVHTDGRNYLLEDLTAEPEDSGFRRLRAIAD
jgi:hypothetical protein